MILAHFSMLRNGNDLDNKKVVCLGTISFFKNMMVTTKNTSTVVVPIAPQLPNGVFILE